MDSYVVKILSEFNLVIGNLVPDAYNQVALIVVPCLVATLALALTLLGIRVMTGQVQSPKELYVFMGKAIFAIVVISGWGEVTRLLYELFSQVTMYFGDHVINIVSGKLNVGNVMPSIPGVSGIGAAMDQAILTFHAVANHLTKNAGWKDFSAYFLAFLVRLFGWGIILIGLIEIVVAKLIVAVLFLLLPIMALFLPFQKTEKKFETYLGVLCGYSLILILVPMVIGFSLSFIKWSLILGKVISLTGQVIGLSNWGMIVPFILVGGICLVLVVTAGHIAKQIGSGSASSSGMAMLAGAAAGAMGGFALGKGMLGASANTTKTIGKGAGTMLSHALRAAQGTSWMSTAPNMASTLKPENLLTYKG
jgi:hypothetical protein